ncbi:hypothetical protein D9M68_894500 [compost metagenome]
MVDRHDRLRSQQRQRIDADHDRHRQRLALLHRSLIKGVQMARQHQYRHPVLRIDLDADDRDVLLAGRRIARNHEAGSDIGPAVVLAMRGNRQQRTHVDFLVHDLLAAG